MFDIYVINLESRKDRFEYIQQKFGNDFNIIRIDAIFDKEGWKGCLKSHLKCVSIAKENNMKYIIVMEDDCEPMDINWKQRLIEFKENLFDKRDDWDIFLGGSAKTWTTRISKFDYSNDNIYKVNFSHNTHMIVYNHTSYDFFLNASHELPIDVLWHKKIRCLIPLPFMFSCQSGYSNIGKTYSNIKKLILDNQNKLIEYVKINNI